MASIERYLRITFERRTLKGLEGRYQGPKKLKSSGKAAGRKKKKHDRKEGKKPAAKAEGKQRLRERKRTGKRAAAPPSPPADLADGFLPLRKRPANDD
jgi:hypothetical protein